MLSISWQNVLKDEAADENRLKQNSGHLDTPSTIINYHPDVSTRPPAPASNMDDAMEEPA